MSSTRARRFHLQSGNSLHIARQAYFTKFMCLRYTCIDGTSVKLKQKDFLLVLDPSEHAETTLTLILFPNGRDASWRETGGARYQMNSLEISKLNLNLIQLYRSQRVADVATAGTENTLSRPLSHENVNAGCSRAHEFRNYPKPSLGPLNNLSGPLSTRHVRGQLLIASTETMRFSKFNLSTANEPSQITKYLKNVIDPINHANSSSFYLDSLVHAYKWNVRLDTYLC